MKFTINRHAFLNHLNDATRAIANNATLAVLKGLKIELSQDELTLIGSDSDLSIVSQIAVDDLQYEMKVFEIGQTLVPARLFSEIIRKLPGDTFLFEMITPHNAKIESGKAVFNIVCLPVNEYPELPDLTYDQKITLNSSRLKRLIQQTIFAASNQESSLGLTGINLAPQPSYIAATASDSHRLSYREMAYPDGLTQESGDRITVPKKTMSELARILEDDQDVSIMINENEVIFQVAHTTIFSRILDGKFPLALNLIPKNYSTEITINSAELLAAIDRASLVSREDKPNVVHLLYVDGELTIAVKGNEVGKVEENIQVIESKGEDVKAGFNPDYMKDALRPFEGEDVTLKFNSNTKPLIIQAAQSETIPHNALFQLLTPIRTHA
ncbi:TPA: DNA polymerase III subunit beta [Streptococcus suis]